MMRSPIHRRTPAARAAVAVAVLCAAAVSGWAEEYRIVSMEASATPRVENGKIYYSLEVLFDQRPSNYWIYFDRNTKQLVMEMLDAQVTAPRFRFPRRSPFGQPRIEINRKSTKSLTRVQSRILAPLDPAWHVEASDQGDATVRIVVWKNLDRTMTTRKKSARVLVYPVVAAAAGLATFLVVLLVRR